MHLAKFNELKSKLIPTTAMETPRTGLKTMLAERKVALDKAETIVKACESSGRRMTESETADFDAAMAEVKALTPHIDRIQAVHTKTTEWSPSKHGAFHVPGLADFISHGEGNFQASLSEGGDLQYILPPHTIEPFRSAYPNIDPFRAAGASIVELDAAWSDAKIPFVIPGTEPSVYAEGAGPSSDESASVKTVVLDSPAKLAFLCKPTEESMDDILGLSGAITAEGIRRIANKSTKTATSALLSALMSAGATVEHVGDNLEDLLNMVAAIPTFFAGPGNCWMGSRRTRALLRNTRAGADNLPVFDTTQTNLLGYQFVVNDYIPAGQLVYGDFSNGVHLRRSALFLQRLDEAYREAGKIGFRFYQRTDQAFFAEVANATEVENPLYLLTSEMGS